MQKYGIVAAAVLVTLGSVDVAAQQVDIVSSSGTSLFESTDLNVGGGYGWTERVGSSQQGATGKRLATGINSLTQNRFENAEASFSAILKRSPNNLQALIFSGASRELQGNWSGAAERYKAAAILRPSEVYLQQLLGVTYAKAGNRAEALDVRAGLVEWSKLCAHNCTDAAALKKAVAAIDGVL